MRKLGPLQAREKAKACARPACRLNVQFASSIAFEICHSKQTAHQRCRHGHNAAIAHSLDVKFN